MSSRPLKSEAKSIINISKSQNESLSLLKASESLRKDSLTKNDYKVRV